MSVAVTYVFTYVTTYTSGYYSARYCVSVDHIVTLSTDISVNYMSYICIFSDKYNWYYDIILCQLMLMAIYKSVNS